MLILGALYPYLVVGATKKWTHLTGFLMSEVLSKDLSFLEGAQSNKALFRNVCAEVCRGRTAHACLTHYRRDGSAFVNSVHGFPVYDGNHCVGADDMSSHVLNELSMCESERTGVSTTAESVPGVGTYEEGGGDVEQDMAVGNAISDSFSSSVSAGVHLENVHPQVSREPSQGTINPLNGKGSQHKSTGSLGEKSVESHRSTFGRKSPLLGYGSGEGESNGKVAFIVLQFSVIVDSRGSPMLAGRGSSNVSSGDANR